ncbi:TolC family protein [Sphingobacterium sp. MYb382]|uniref:TolC family protein n=1 Tax=Sphingobacterium sp. MYb382 TaxID=2745278 RepID=UPI0030A33018
MKVFKYIYVSGTAVLLLTMTGCSAPKELQHPRVEQDALPTAFRLTHEELATDSLSNLAELPYQQFFQDAYLIGLIDTALAHNNNMLVAVKQIEIAQETVKQMKWGYLPTVDLAVGAANINRPSNNSMNGMMASQFMGKRYMEDYSTTLSVSWEADIWGKIKERNAMALAGYLETQEAVNAVRTSLIANVAQGYYMLLLLDQQTQVSQQNLAIIDSTLNITKVQQRLGLTTSLAIKQLENNRDNLLKSIRIIEENKAVQENAMSALLGRMPQELKNRGSLLNMQEVQVFGTGVPAELLSRRPDIKQAELTLTRSVSEIKVARANMYPSLRITAQGGLNAFKSSNWFSIPGSLFGTVAGSLTQPILQGRQLKTAYNQATIRSEQAELRYKESMLQAVTEVSTILEQLASLQEQQQVNELLVDRNRVLLKDANILFKNDMASYLDVLAAQQVKLQAELDQISVKSRLLQTQVALYRALGGGVI